MQPPPAQAPISSRRSVRDSLNKLVLAALAFVGVALLVSLTILALTRPAPVLSSGSTPMAIRPREAGQRGLDWLLNSAVEWQRRENCYGCHVQSFAVLGAGVGKANRYDIDQAQADELADYLVSIQGSNGDLTAGGGRTIHPGVQTALGGLGLSHYEGDYGTALARMADWFIEQQAEDGRWPIDHHEAPVDQGDVMMTSSVVETIVAAQHHQKRDEYTEAIDRAAQWLRSAPLETTQDITFAIIGLRVAEVKESDVDVKRLVELLRSRQRDDGGWGETVGLDSSGYATGQVLYAFKQAQVSIRDNAFQRGALWLLENQQADGSWQQINSQQTSAGRSSNFATTMWAAIGLGEVFDVQTERTFMSLIHADRGLLTWPAVLLFYIIPLLLVTPVVWR
ncbi:MAG: prenyltransferase/squalene oxidase repeat-containing protein [Anaerolineae bacterium]